MIVSKLTVFFEEPFWVGICEQRCDEGYKACKITFGAEPKDYEVYDFILKNWFRLRFSPAVEMEVSVDRRMNPKRMQREVRKQTKPAGVGTKAQQALKLQHEQIKTEHRACAKEQSEAEKDRLRALKEQKRKEKHRGH